MLANNIATLLRQDRLQQSSKQEDSFVGSVCGTEGLLQSRSNFVEDINPLLTYFVSSIFLTLLRVFDTVE